MKRILSVLMAALLLCSCMKDFSMDMIDMAHEDMSVSGMFPDPAFAEYILDTFDGSADGIKDGILQAAEIEKVRTIDCSGLGIATLDGIGVFSSLDTLICRGNRLTSLGLNAVPGLKYLDCSSNLITELNVSSSDISTLFCCPMTGADGKNVLGYLYVRRGQEIQYITSDRSKADPKRIPDETLIIAIPEVKDELEPDRNISKQFLSICVWSGTIPHYWHFAEFKA